MTEDPREIDRKRVGHEAVKTGWKETGHTGGRKEGMREEPIE